MLNLLKSDLDRLAHGKMLWVLLALISAVVALTIAGSWFVGTDTFRAMTKKNANANSQASVSFSVSNNNNNIDEAALDEIQAQATTTSGLTTVAGGTAFGMGFILLLNGLFTALFLSSDHKSGFEKTMLAAQRNRGVYYLEKLLIVALVSFIFVLVEVISSAIGTTIVKFHFTNSDSFSTLLAWMGSAWLIVFAYGCIVACVTWLSGSITAGAVTAVCITMIEGAIQAILTRFLPGSAAITSWMPISSIGPVGAGSDFLSAAKTSAEVVSPLAHVLITGIVCIIVFGGISLVFVRKKDI